MSISDWGAYVCSSDLGGRQATRTLRRADRTCPSRRTLAAVVHPANDLCQDRPDFVSRRFCATTGFAPDRMMLFGRMLVGRPRLDEGGEPQFLADGAGEFDRIVHFASVERIDHRGQQPEKIDLAPAARAFIPEERRVGTRGVSPCS